MEHFQKESTSKGALGKEYFKKSTSKGVLEKDHLKALKA